MSDQSEIAYHYECSLEEYHSETNVWSHSQTEDLIKSPPLFHGRHITGKFARKSSRDYDAGTVCHELLNKGGSLANVVRVIPADVLNADGHRRGKNWQAWSQENAGFIQMTASEIDPILCMCESVKAACPSWITSGDGYHEYSIKWQDEDTGLWLRARPDRICCTDADEVVLVDWKTTRSYTARTFANDMAEFGYHRQAAWYSTAAEQLGWRVKAFLFVAVDKTPAHECRIFELDRRAMELGRQENAQAVHELAYRLESNNWLSADHGQILTIDLPEWKYRPNQWEH